MHTWWRDVHFQQVNIPVFFYLQADSEVAQAGKAVALYFEDKLTEIYPDRTFQPLPEFEQEEDDGEITEDSDEDFIQPRRKRLKSDERPVHIK